MKCVSNVISQLTAFAGAVTMAQCWCRQHGLRVAQHSFCDMDWLPNGVGSDGDTDDSCG